MSLTAVSYPYITTNPDILGGVPIIEGTRIPVRAIAAYYQMGMSVDEILMSLSLLRPAQVHSALAYYFDHQQEVDQDLANASDLKLWKSQLLTHPQVSSD